MMIAPTIGPVKADAPPRIAISSTSADCCSEIACGEMNRL